MTDLPEREPRGSGIVAEVATPRIRRVFYDYRDFRLRLDDSSPVHYDVDLTKRDSKGRIWMARFKLFGRDRKGRLMIFEQKWLHSDSLSYLRPAMVNTFVAKYARPLNAVPGRLEVAP